MLPLAPSDVDHIPVVDSQYGDNQAMKQSTFPDSKYVSGSKYLNESIQDSEDSEQRYMDIYALYMVVLHPVLGFYDSSILLILSCCSNIFIFLFATSTYSFQLQQQIDLHLQSMLPLNFRSHNDVLPCL